MDFKGLSGFSSERYRAGDRGVIVYLESTDDVFIFKKWFGNHLSRIEFKAVSGEKANGGCRVVISKVNEEADTTMPCYGIVDRDALLNTISENEALWWETDDETFFSAQPFGNRVFVLNRWELENYLLHPQAVRRRLENKTMENSGYTDHEALAEDIIAAEEDMVALTVLATLGKDREPGYARELSGDKLWERVQTEANASREQINEHRSKVMHFAQDTNTPIERWNRLSRLLDGKKSMVRFDVIFAKRNIRTAGSKKYICLQDERADLADDVANLDLIDPNLKSWIQHLGS
ncbi:MAG: hypothetical protein ACWA5R_11560 [bacterium]